MFRFVRTTIRQRYYEKFKNIIPFATCNFCVSESSVTEKLHVAYGLTIIFLTFVIKVPDYDPDEPKHAALV